MRSWMYLLLIVSVLPGHCGPRDDPLPHFYMDGTNPDDESVGIVLDRPDTLTCFENALDGTVREQVIVGDGRWSRDGLRVFLDGAPGCLAWFRKLDCDYRREGRLIPVDVLDCRDTRGRRWRFYRDIVRL